MSGAEIVARAPGKLFIAGEYAVVTPGEPAVLVAVDRFLEVRLVESDGAGSIHSPEYGQLPLVWTRADDGLSLDREHHPYDYVFAVIELAERLRLERGLAPRFFELVITSGLDDAHGRKFGLGSSAAVTVATVRAIDAFYGFGLSTRQIFQLALLSTIRVSPVASGGDLAASVYGGWVGYRAPDRALLGMLVDDMPIEALLADEKSWRGLQIASLPAPGQLEMLVGWTGSPASTERLVDGVNRRALAGTYDHEAFVRASRVIVDRLWSALEQSQGETVIAQIRAARQLLRDLGEASHTPIETPRLTALCEIAEGHGAAAKSSGAGGGDCGILLVPRGGDASAILSEWRTAGIHPLSLAVHGRQEVPCVC